jgi:hypothetical protein
LLFIPEEVAEASDISQRSPHYKNYLAMMDTADVVISPSPSERNLNSGVNVVNLIVALIDCLIGPWNGLLAL